MTKCDFCKRYDPFRGECHWNIPGFRHDDCEKAIKLMVEALKGGKEGERKAKNRR